MLALLGLVSAALFTGASLYVSLVEHPARLRLDERNALAQWQPSYDRAAIMQAGLALVSGLAGLAAWWRWRSVWPWLAGGVLMLAIIAFTLLVIWQTNKQLKATAPDAASAETRALLVKWGQLHWVRSAMTVLATGFFVNGMT